MTDALLARRLALFSELIELDPSDCEARLAAVEQESPELVAALRRMLAADAEAEGLLDRSLAQLPTELGAARMESDWETRPGEQLGPYELLEPLGEGGMGEVWAARRRDGAYDQRVALKLLKRGVDTQAILRRFLQERHILARLQHPGIVRLLDGGMSEGGRPWYAMELVEGATLLRHASTSGLDLRARVELLAEVADAVAYAHARLVVHRDLKPGNVMIDASGRPRLLDFGIAKLLEDSGEDTLTGTGVRVLSPAYAAPEQILGEPISTATDVYALGMLGYELLTGRLPHRRSSREMAALAGEVSRETQSLRASHAVAGSSAAEVHQHYGHALDPLRLARQLRGDLDHVLAMALRPEPERRYAGAAEFAAELRAWLEQRPVRARGDSAGYRTRRFMRRHAGGVAAAGIVLLALIGGLGSALWQAQVARSEAARADAEAERARSEAQRARRASEFLVSVFIEADPLRGSDRGEMSLGEAFEEALARVDAMSTDIELKIDLLDDFGEMLLAKGRTDEGEQRIREALRLAELTYGPDHPAVAESLLNLFAAATYRSQPTAAADELRRALAIIEAHPAVEPQQRVAALNQAAILAMYEQGPRAALASMERAFEALQAHPELPTQLAENLLVNRGFLAINLGDRLTARESLLAALELRRDERAERSPALVMIYQGLAWVAYLEGDLAEEQRMHELELAQVSRVYPGDHPWRAKALEGLGSASVRAGDSARAVELLGEAVELQRRLGSSQPAGALIELARVHIVRGELQAALALIEEALAACRAEVGGCDRLPQTAAWAFALAGRVEDAHEQLVRVEQEFPVDGDLPVARASALVDRARVYAVLEEPEQARAVLDEARTLVGGVAPEHPMLGVIERLNAEIR